MSGIYSITMVYANHTFTGSARIVTSLITGFQGLEVLFSLRLLALLWTQAALPQRFGT